MKEYCARKQFSGHSRKIRGQVVRSALNAYDTIREKDERGKVPMYRARELNREEIDGNRRKNKRDCLKRRMVGKRVWFSSQQQQGGSSK